MTNETGESGPEGETGAGETLSRVDLRAQLNALLTWVRKSALLIIIGLLLSVIALAYEIHSSNVSTSNQDVLLTDLQGGSLAEHVAHRLVSEEPRLAPYATALVNSGLVAMRERPSLSAEDLYVLVEALGRRLLSMPTPQDGSDGVQARFDDLTQAGLGYLERGLVDLAESRFRSARNLAVREAEAAAADAAAFLRAAAASSAREATAMSVYPSRAREAAARFGEASSFAVRAGDVHAALGYLSEQGLLLRSYGEGFGDVAALRAAGPVYEALITLSADALDLSPAERAEHHRQAALPLILLVSMDGEGADRAAEAARAHLAQALELIERESDIEVRAAALSSLGETYRLESGRTRDRTLLDKAQTVLESAWGLVESSGNSSLKGGVARRLADVLNAQGQYGLEFYDRALEYYDIALGHFSLETDLDNHAKVLINRAVALIRRAQSSEAGAEGLVAAAASLDSLIEVEALRRDLPQTYVLAQNVRGVALMSAGGSLKDEPTLLRAQDAFEAGLESVRATGAPVDWAMLESNLGEVLSWRAEVNGDSRLILEALNHYQRALDSTAIEGNRSLWLTIQRGIGGSLTSYAEAEGSLEHAQQAEAHFSGLLADIDRNLDPGNWARVQNSAANAEHELGVITGDPAYFERAIDRYSQARAVFQGLQFQALADVVGENLASSQQALAENTAPVEEAP